MLASEAVMFRHMANEEPQPRRIEISREVADAAAMPDDLQSVVLEPYAVPNVNQRRRAGRVYVIGAAIAALGIALGLPSGMWLVVVLFLAIAGFHWLGGWDLKVMDGEALEIANRHAEFPAGHASAALNFQGWRARPIWNVLMFSAEDPPTQRGLVRVDGLTGEVVGSYVEDIDQI
jgi:hypothetical protein